MYNFHKYFRLSQASNIEKVDEPDSRMSNEVDHDAKNENDSAAIVVGSDNEEEGSGGTLRNATDLYISMDVANDQLELCIDSNVQDYLSMTSDYVGKYEFVFEYLFEKNRSYS